MLCKRDSQNAIDHLSFHDVHLTAVQELTNLFTLFTCMTTDTAAVVVATLVWVQS